MTSLADNRVQLTDHTNGLPLALTSLIASTCSSSTLTALAWCFLLPWDYIVCAETWAWRESATGTDGTRLMLTTTSSAACVRCRWAGVLQLALGDYGLTAGDAAGQFLEDNRPAPDLAAGLPIVASYADNGNIMA